MRGGLGGGPERGKARSHECERCTHVPRGRPVRYGHWSLGPPYCGEGYLRRVLFGVMDGVMGYYAAGFVVVVAAGVQVAVESGEIAARYFDSDSMACREVVTCRHG